MCNDRIVCEGKRAKNSFGVRTDNASAHSLTAVGEASLVDGGPDSEAASFKHRASSWFCNVGIFKTRMQKRRCFFLDFFLF